MARLRDDILLATPVMTNLLTRFEVEAEEEGGNGQYYGVIQRDNGEWIDHNPHSPEFDPAQAMFARDVVELLNKELHHDGCWVIVFTHPRQRRVQLREESGRFAGVYAFAQYDRFGFIWLDSDGDPQFTMDWANGECEELDFAECLVSGRESWADRCEAAWQKWNLYMRKVLQPKQDQLIKKAQGQRPRGH
jgi:hypothetical protein